jgi:leader peptidase (prepilin peptidase) / N-methyltransferase
VGERESGGAAADAHGSRAVAVGGPAPRQPTLRDDLATAGVPALLLGVLLAVLAASALAGEGWAVAGAGGYLALVGTLLAAVDLRTHRLPDRLVLPGAAGVLLLLLLAAATQGAWTTLGRAVVAALVSLVGYFLLALLRAGGLGLGDVKLGGLLGVWLGWFGWSHVVGGVLAAFGLGGLVALALLLTRRVSRSSAIAFGPWMVLGAAATTALALAGEASLAG